MRLALCCLALLGLFTSSDSFAVQARRIGSDELTLSTLNVRWFGLGGSMNGNAGQERRDASLRDFIQQKMMPSNVIAFQEIVDVPRLQRLLPQGWTCVSYRNSNPKHQYVVLCAESRYRFDTVSYDNNYTIEEVALDAERSRPAIRVDLVDTRQRKKILRLVAVHLKAFPQEASTRERQATKIAADLAQGTERLPVVVMGDFNTYPSASTGQSQDDIDLIGAGLDLRGSEYALVHVRHRARYTFRKDEVRGQFDQFYVSRDISVKGSPQVFPVCDATADGSGFENASFYYSHVSDHCPSTLTISLKNAPSLPLP